MPRKVLSGEFADDASFLRKLKPSLIVARAKGATTARAPSSPQLGRRTPAKDGPNPFVVAGAAFGLGTVLARIIDWRGHAHPKR